jgi:hypothetical protein
MEIPIPGEFTELFGYGMQASNYGRAYRAIKPIPGAWAALARSSTNSFMIGKSTPGLRSSEPILRQIEEAVLNSTGHSGYSYGDTMRQMEQIAKLGWDKYATQILIHNAAEKEAKIQEKRDNELKRTNDTYPDNYGQQENYFPNNYQVVGDEPKPKSWLSWGGKKSKKYKKSKKSKKYKKSKKSKTKKR